IIQVELSRPIPDLDAAISATGHPYERGYVLARLHSEPVGIFEMKLGKDRVAAGDFAAVIWEELGSAIAKHLEQDGITAVDRLPEKGIRAATAPVCRRNRIRAQQIAAPVSVVVATHDRPAGLDRCLRSLLRQDYPNFEILVVDNAPGTDAAVELIRKRYGSSEKVRYLREDYPGLAAAHNRGLEDVRGQIVAFTDDDVVADEHWLTALVGGFAEADDVACVTGMIFPAELETSAQGWIEQFGGFGKGISRRIFSLSSNVAADPLYPYTAGMFGSGANMAFRTSVLRGLGGFDPALGAGSRGVGGDDLAAFFEVVTRGYSLVYEPAALVYHWHRREYEGLRKQAYGYGVGLTAYLTKTLLDRPSRVFELARRVPGGMKHIFSSRSAKNRGKLSDYPKELTRMERKGMLQGPFAYISSRRQAKKMGKYIRHERERSETTPSLSGAGSEALRV
ncbi:MAG: glycosyltransferase family 2 protein, partial [Spirochaetaceae bacterium]